MANDNEWKRYFLASGVPLEYEVASVLSRLGFYVSADFQYSRRDGETEKEFSVDISANWYNDRGGSIKFSMDMLIECKYRSRDKYIVLFRDPNIGDDSITPGYTITKIDQFSPFYLESHATHDFEGTLPFVYKGVEVHEKGAVEKDLRHGVHQLQYAAPIHLKDIITGIINDHPDDRHPHFVCRILVTNSRLKVLRQNATISTIESISDIDQISDEHDVVIMRSESGPDFRAHYRRIMEPLGSEEMREEVNRLEYHLEREGKRYPYRWDRPDNFLSSIANLKYPATMMSCHIFIVSLPGLASFITELKTVCAESYRKRRKGSKWHRK